MFSITILILLLAIIGCSTKLANLTEGNLKLVNREILSIDKSTNSISLNAKRGDGLAIIEDLDFESGTIELDLKGENIRGKSFIGFAFNIQNDSTYEAIYFRPFNFQSEKLISRQHSIQYISHPKNTWRFLRTNFEGQYEAEYGRQPAPEKWFTVRIEIEDEMVTVYDKISNSKLMSVQRLEKRLSNKIGLWTGFNSKGVFRNLRIIK